MSGIRETPAPEFDPRDAFEAWADQDNRDLAAQYFEDREPENFMYYATDGTNQAYIGWYFASKQSCHAAPHDEAEHFIQAAVDNAPEPLRRLGEWLANILDDDQWPTAERMLLGAAVSIKPPAVSP
jgi:hypothetical protein